MLNAILVPLDGSRFAEAALPCARRLAEASGGVLQLALAHHALPAWNPAITFPDGGATIEQQTRAREAAYLAGLAGRLSADLGRAVPHALLDGPPGEVIVRHAAQGAAGMIVMATHGRGPASRFWLGSTTDYVLRHGGVPVLAVRPPEGDGEAPSAEFRRLLVPVDESPLSRAVLGPAAELARLTGAAIILLTVVEPVIGIMDPAMPFPAAMDPEAEAARETAAKAALEDIAAALRATGLVVHVRVAVALGVGATILELADREQADLIAMSTHGQGGVRRALLGSVTDKVIRGASQPVLAWRPPSP